MLTSPDAQRTFLSYLGTSAAVTLDDALVAAIAASRMLVIEGYLWELPHAEDTIAQVRVCAISVLVLDLTRLRVLPHAAKRGSPDPPKQEPAPF